MALGWRTVTGSKADKHFPWSPPLGTEQEGGASRALEAGSEKPASKISYLKNNANSWLVFTLIKDVVND